MKLFTITLFIAVLLCGTNLISSFVIINKSDGVDNCVLENSLKREISSYQSIVDRIISYVKHGPFKRRTYSE